MKTAWKVNAMKSHYAISVPEGAQAYALSRLLSEADFLREATSLIHVAATDRDAKVLAEVLPFFIPDAQVIYFCGWDCLPYDRVSPHPQVVAERMRALREMLSRSSSRHRVVVTTAGAITQKLPPAQAIKAACLDLQSGKPVQREALLQFFTRNGYVRVGKAMETGEYALRGNIIDIVPSGYTDGIRLDLFGDDIETIRRFDPMTQRSAGSLERLDLHPMSEVMLNEERIESFRTRYRECFGAVRKEDALYHAISESVKYVGMEHWMPLFYERMDTLFDYVPNAAMTVDLQVEQVIVDRHAAIRDYYEARVAASRIKTMSDALYLPLPPDYLYVMEQAWIEQLEKLPVARMQGFEDGQAASYGIKAGVSLAALRRDPAANPFAQLKEFAAGKRNNKQSTLLACLSEGSRERIAGLLAQADVHCIRIDQFRELKNVSGKALGLCVLPLNRGFEAEGFALLTEQDLLGERIIRSRPKKRKADAYLAEAAPFLEGELVVHREHGIGRFDGLVSLEVMGATHDCLKLSYADDDRLFLPVENIDLLTRYGAEDENAKLDKLGAASWQSRKARMKERIKLAAEQLMRTAAERSLATAPALEAESNGYAAFCARFPYAETEDQERSINEVTEDLCSGHPMDRLICGDVGFGKTEVALRAAFVATHAAMHLQHMPEGMNNGGMQVALIAPTTLLARQHYQNFRARFEGFGVTVRSLSRLIPAKEQRQVREGLKDGSVDIVVGTHALLAKGIAFQRLGLVIVDEEQHFGVAQKERLKELKHGVHVLTLSATPIPRTLQMALSGVRSLSLIATPPVDRLAVRSFVMPFDPVVLREAILRERNRGGRIFVVTPRIEGMVELKRQIAELVPEINIALAHGQMPPADLDTIMNEFYDGKYDLLLSTSIIESGLDIPGANTIIVHRADRFGLAQLYQLRGRVGRGKQRAYAYFLLPSGKLLSKNATRRLEVMQTLDSLGAGFTVASHDMDIRGFGNMVGEEQSGHIREVGVELYQQMLAETMAALKNSGGDAPADAAADWSPQINLSMSVLIPESYVADLQLRMGLYRRAAHLQDAQELDAMAAELIDRFGPMPEEVEHLLAVVRIKQMCRAVGVERLDAGPKGALLTFRKPYILSAEKLLAFMGRNPTRAKLRPDEKLFFAHDWNTTAQKITGVQALLTQLALL